MAAVASTYRLVMRAGMLDPGQDARQIRDTTIAHSKRQSIQSAVSTHPRPAGSAD